MNLKIDRLGRVTIPLEIMKKLKINKNSLVNIEFKEDKLVLSRRQKDLLFIFIKIKRNLRKNKQYYKNLIKENALKKEIIERNKIIKAKIDAYQEIIDIIEEEEAYD